MKYLIYELLYTWTGYCNFISYILHRYLTSLYQGTSAARILVEEIWLNVLLYIALTPACAHMDTTIATRIVTAVSCRRAIYIFSYFTDSCSSNFFFSYPLFSHYKWKQSVLGKWLLNNARLCRQPLLQSPRLLSHKTVTAKEVNVLGKEGEFSVRDAWDLNEWKAGKKYKCKSDINIYGQDIKRPKPVKTSEQQAWFSLLVNPPHIPVELCLWDAAEG